MKTLEFIKNNNGKNDIEESVIVFGLDMLKTVIIEIIVAVVLAIFAGCFWRAMIFLVTLMPLRQYAGGYHTRSRISCAVMSTVIYALELLLLKYVNIWTMWQILGMFISAFIIILLAPVENRNNPLDTAAKMHFKNRTRMMLLIDMLIFTILMVAHRYDYSFMIFNSVELVAILCIMGYISNKIDERR